jgi:hypothetical protein
MFQQALTISKLVQPDADHAGVGQGLADALFGQGKVRGACYRYLVRSNQAEGT